MCGNELPRQKRGRAGEVEAPLASLPPPWLLFLAASELLVRSSSPALELELELELLLLSLTLLFPDEVEFMLSCRLVRRLSM